MSSKKKNVGISVVETFIGASTVFKGDISVKNSIRIDGIMEGSIIEADGVVIGEKSSVKGNISANIVVIGGKVTGNITAVHNIEILSKAEVHGNIHSTLLSVAEGAILEGSCTALADQHKPIQLNVETSAK